MLKAPYNFVPLSNKIFYPYWANEVHHDIPLPSAESGVIELEIESKSPIFVKNYNKEDSVNEFCHFVKDGKKQYFIPATSIKGMIRNVLEIMSFSRMNFVDDKTYSMRDLNNNDYKQKAIKDIKCGWLYKEENSYKILNCDKIHRITYQEIGKIFNIKGYKDKFAKGIFDESNSPYKNACGKYDLIGFEKCIKIRNFSAKNSKNNILCTEDKNGNLRGVIVLTGHPSGRNENDKIPTGKNLDFVFLEKENAEIYEVSENVFENFKFAYFDGRKTQPKESVDWAFWKKKLENKERIPVFFHLDDKKKVRSFGLSYLYKIPYQYSIGDALKRTHIQRDDIDLSELIFGYSKKINEKQDSLKGRVFISHAIQNGAIKELNERDILLGSPKPSYYPNYIVQDKKNGYVSLMDSSAKLSGYKRYPIHEQINKQKIDSSTQTKKIKPLDIGAKFKFKIVIHNLLPVEIGALLSAITFHGENSCFHSIGMAKPLGYGKIKLSISSLNGFLKNEKEYMKIFESAINSEIFDGKEKWHESDQIKNLFTMASKQNNGGESELSYMELKEFAKAKSSKLSLKKYIEFDEISIKMANKISDIQSIKEYSENKQIFNENILILEKQKKDEEAKIKLEEETKNLSELDKKLYLFHKQDSYKSTPELTANIQILKKENLNNDEKLELAYKIKNEMKANSKWKENTGAKKPEKDKDYQNTLYVKEIIERLEKNE